MNEREHLARALQRASASQEPPELMVSNVMHAIRTQSHSTTRITRRMTSVVLSTGLILLVTGVALTASTLMSSKVSVNVESYIGPLRDIANVPFNSVLVVVASLLLALLIAHSVEARTR